MKMPIVRKNETPEAALQRCNDIIATNKAAYNSSELVCPVCGQHFKKRRYKKFAGIPMVFCSAKGDDNCKDAYWNLVSEVERLQISEKD